MQRTWSKSDWQNRHQPTKKGLRDNVQGITKTAINRLARRRGVKRISGLIYEDTRGAFLGTSPLMLSYCTRASQEGRLSPPWTSSTLSKEKPKIQRIYWWNYKTPKERKEDFKKSFWGLEKYLEKYSLVSRKCTLWKKTKIIYFKSFTL